MKKTPFLAALLLSVILALIVPTSITQAQSSPIFVSDSAGTLKIRTLEETRLINTLYVFDKGQSEIIALQDSIIKHDAILMHQYSQAIIARDTLINQYKINQALSEMMLMNLEEQLIVANTTIEAQRKSLFNYKLAAYAGAILTVIAIVR